MLRGDRSRYRVRERYRDRNREEVDAELENMMRNENFRKKKIKHHPSGFEFLYEKRRPMRGDWNYRNQFF